MENRRFVITKLDADGSRIMSYPHNNRNTYETEREARDQLIAIICNNTAGAVADYLGDIEAVQVLPVDCYSHGDPKHTVFNNISRDQDLKWLFEAGQKDSQLWRPEHAIIDSEGFTVISMSYMSESVAREIVTLHNIEHGFN